MGVAYAIPSRDRVGEGKGGGEGGGEGYVQAMIWLPTTKSKTFASACELLLTVVSKL